MPKIENLDDLRWEAKFAPSVARVSDWCLKRKNVIRPPTPVQEIIEGLGIKVELGDTGQYSSVIEKISSRKMIINRNDHLFKQRFSMAHAMGHFIHNKESQSFSCDHDFEMYARVDELTSEQFSSRFACNLLVPGWILEYAHHGTWQDLSQYYKAPISAIKWQMAFLVDSVDAPHQIK